MIKNNKGVTLMSLIITVVVMVILLSIVGYFSLDSVKNSYTANEKKELVDVAQYVSAIKIKLLLGEFDINEEYENAQNKIVTSEAVHLIASGLTESELVKIKTVNETEDLDENYKYFYITAEDLKRESIAKENIVVKDPKNDYIINFFTGTTIALYDGGKRVEVSGSVKDLNEIMAELY